jgi:hypothetical protein
MIHINTLNGTPYQKIYVTEDCTIYEHLLKLIKKPIHPKFREIVSPIGYYFDGIYIKTLPQLFQEQDRKMEPIVLTGEIDFEKILYVSFNFEYYVYKTYSEDELRYRNYYGDSDSDSDIESNSFDEEEEERYIWIQIYDPFIGIDNQTNELCKKMIEKHKYAIAFVKNQTQELANICISKYPDLIQYIDKMYQTRKLRKIALKYNPINSN